MTRWGTGDDVVDEGRLVETVADVVGDRECSYGSAVVGVGIELGSVELVRRGVGMSDVALNGGACGGKWTYVDYAIRVGDDVGMLEALVGVGANVNGKSGGMKHGGTYLHNAAYIGRVMLCDALIRLGVDVHGVNDVRSTALHTAAEFGRMEVCEVLVARGANVGAVNKWNMTAAFVARRHGHVRVSEYLDGLVGR
jgi:hypothetical protein